MPSNEDKQKGGQPPKYKTPEELQKKIDSIIAKYESDGYICNMTLLTADLGFANRQSINDYMNRSPEFSDIIKRTKTKIAGIKIMKAEKGEINTTMAIFDLKCNHDHVETKHVVVEDKSDLLSRVEEAKRRSTIDV